MEKSKSKVSRIIISLLVIFLAVVSSWFFFSSKKSINSQEDLRVTISLEQKRSQELIDSLQYYSEEEIEARILLLEEENNLRSELDNIIEQYDNSRNEIDNLHVDLDEKQSEIDNLKSEIRDLLNVKNDLKEAKKKIITLQNISKKYFAQLDSLLGKTEQLELDLKGLEEENIVIKNKNKNLNSENTDLNNRLEVGSILEIFKIKLDKLKYGSHGQERKVIITKNIQVLRCCFTISANLIATAEIKSVYIQYISPSGKLLQSSNTPEEATFVYEDSTIHTTTYSEFKYQNNEIELCVDWERGDPLERGKHKILFFIEGTLVAASSFKLN